MSETSSTAFLLPLSMELAVNLNIAALREQGGPSETQQQWASTVGPRLAEQGDDLLFAPVKGRQTGRPGATATLFNDVALGIAILAFQPGGITIFGRHFEAESGLF